MNHILRLRFAILAAALASSLLLHSAGCGTCEDGCSGGPPIEPEVYCSQSDLQDELRFLGVGDRARLEYGPQGGQHFFVSFATRPLAPEEQLLVVFETESDRVDSLPSVDRSCGEISGVVVSELALTMPSDDEVDGTLTVAIVVCEGNEDGSCSWDESGDVVDYEVRAELSKDLRVAP